MSLWTRFARALDNPIVVKEGISRMRTWRAPVVATLYLALIGAVGYAWLTIGVASSQASRNAPAAAVVGSSAFAAMAFFQLALVCLFAPALAAGAISGERERQTLDVLLVSRVSAFGIVWGKLLASMAYVLLLVLTALPLFAAVFLFGGIDVGQFVLSQVVTIGTALCIGSMALFFSALFQRSLSATVTAYAAAFVLTVGSALLSLLVSAVQLTAGRNGPSPQYLFAAQWYFNPFFAMAIVLFPTPAARPSLRGFLQLLFFGPPTNGVLATGGPAADPWLICLTFEILISLICVIGAVLLVRGRRVMRPRRSEAPAALDEAR